MRWFIRKLDSLIGAAFAGTWGAVVSQFQAFVHQYLQRLGGHIDEANRNYQIILDSDRYREMDAVTRDVITGDALARVKELKSVYDAITDADIFTRPYEFLVHVDSVIAERTFESFEPALPVDLESLIYAGVGLVLGFIVFEIIKAPLALLFRGKPRERA
jgi:Protein of unknown function (DUF2937)